MRIAFPTFTRRALAEGLAAVFTFPLRHGDGRLGALDLYRDTPGALDPDAMVAAQTLADVAAAYLLNAQARADLVEASARAREDALHDALTGLPNRVLFLERLEHALARVGRTGKMVAVLFADLDRFKAINDVHGHAVGDELLVAVAKRMTAALRPGDTLARLSGDEFVILCEELSATSDADALMVRLSAKLARPFMLSGTEVHVSASVGLAFSGHGDYVAEQILRQADTAMYQAKRNGGAGRTVVDLRDQHRSGRQASLTYDLTKALSQNELGVVYQPIVAAGDGHVLAVEALLRWAHPERGTVFPGTFIPLAERAGLITGIGHWVLEEACRDRSSWQDEGADTIGVSVNVSAHQLMAPNFVTTVAAVLDSTELEARALTLEVTESAFFEDSKRALMVLTDLKVLGVSLALDDFGTGYSSLTHLHRFPIDVVKIDRSFVADMAADNGGNAIVSAVIDLSHALGMTVIGEGVETAEQHGELLSLGCDACQGYYFARELAPDDVDTLLRSTGTLSPTPAP